MAVFGRSGGAGREGEKIDGETSRRSGLTCWMIVRVTGAEVQCSENAGEGEGAPRGKGRGGGWGSAE